MVSVSDGKDSGLFVKMSTSVQQSNSSCGPWVGALLRFCWQGIRSHIAEAAKTASYSELSRAHLALFRYPTLDSSRPSQLAAEAHLSKQAVNDLLRDLECFGYVRREVDPSDRRSRLIRLTPKGTRLETVLRTAAKEADQFIQAQLGPEQFTVLRANLIQIADLWKTPPQIPGQVPTTSKSGASRKNQRPKIRPT